MKWRHGPEWLIDPEITWPIESGILPEITELRKEVCLTMVINNLPLFERFSSFEKTVRVFAHCLRFINDHKFRDIIESLCNSNDVKSKKFASLSPFLDDNGIIRVGGRLHKANLSFAQKHPTLMPKHHLTNCIIREIHQRLLHTGVQATLAATKTSKMGNLPVSRITPSPPFTHTGIDFCGPFLIKEKKIS
ncbi:uncharacterized protein [Prorops nasuta]|uniref:uncharacterized protein n=1 Tax=Prorops nasuta TaxID=863751 RepID=UPI0034CFCC34